MLRSTLRWMTGFSGMDSGKKPEAANSSHRAVPESESSDSIEVYTLSTFLLNKQRLYLTIYWIIGRQFAYSLAKNSNIVRGASYERYLSRRGWSGVSRASAYTLRF